MLKQILLLSALILLFLGSLTRAQAAERDSVILPYPVCGWEKFDSTVAYYEIYKRAGLEGLNLYTFEVDTLGNAELAEIKSICFFCDDGNFELTPEDVAGRKDLFKKVKWEPAKLHGKSINYRIKVPVLYYLRLKDRAPLIIKEADKPVIRKEVHIFKGE